MNSRYLYKLESMGSIMEGMWEVRNEKKKKIKPFGSHFNHLEKGNSRGK